jgi:hypothetical protein
VQACMWCQQNHGGYNQGIIYGWGQISSLSCSICGLSLDKTNCVLGQGTCVWLWGRYGWKQYLQSFSLWACCW